MKLDELREHMRVQEEKPTPIPIEKQPCPKCGRKRKKEIVNDGVLQLTCGPCGLMWQASPHKCALCQDELVGAPDRPCKLCMECAAECPKFFNAFLTTPNSVVPATVLAHRKGCVVCSLIRVEP